MLNNDYNTSECPICLTDINDDDKVMTNCEHIYCKECLDKWFNKGKTSCPNCRKNIEFITHDKNIMRIVKVKEIRNIIVNENNRNNQNNNRNILTNHRNNNRNFLITNNQNKMILMLFICNVFLMTSTGVFTYLYIICNK